MIGKWYFSFKSSWRILTIKSVCYDLLGFKNAKTRPTDAFKVLCFEPDQQEIITTVIPRIVFLCDFGSGK